MIALDHDLVEQQPRRWPPQTGTIIDKRGNPVDVTGPVWRLNDAINPIALNWSHIRIADCVALDAVKAYIGHLIKTQATSSVANAFRRIRFLIDTEAFQQAAFAGTTIPYLAFSQARQGLSKEGQWELHDARAMYRWCAGQRFHGFSHDVLDRIEEWTIGGNPKGRAVRSKDPREGPLTPAEVATLVSHLHAARLRSGMPIQEQAAIVLCLATGSNPGQYASMREEDLVPILRGDEKLGGVLSVPRHKKGLNYYRAEFRKRKLEQFFCSVIEELIADNRRTPHPTDNVSRPLFRRERAPRDERNDGDEWRYHISSAAFTKLLKRGVARMGVVGRDGKPMTVTTRRFRYTLLTRMRRNGASKASMVDAADHTDDQNIEVYAEIGADIVDHLDKALALELAPRAQAFAGIVATEADAVRGDHKGSRRFLVDRQRDRFEPIGNCGKNSFCNITAPYACYRCVKFQAWMDGPHEEVLDQLLRDRSQRARDGLDPKMVAIDDELIMAVASIVKRIQAIRAQRSAAND